MLPKLAADLVVLGHFGFIVFVTLGGLLVLRWPKVMWLHLPAAVWGAVIELAGFVCPLTPLENRLRAAAGEDGYSGGFIDQYLMPLVYPAGLSRAAQVLLGALVIAINLVFYGVLVVRHRRRRENA